MHLNTRNINDVSLAQPIRASKVIEGLVFLVCETGLYASVEVCQSLISCGLQGTYGIDEGIPMRVGGILKRV